MTKCGEVGCWPAEANLACFVHHLADRPRTRGWAAIPTFNAASHNGFSFPRPARRRTCVHTPWPSLHAGRLLLIWRGAYAKIKEHTHGILHMLDAAVLCTHSRHARYRLHCALGTRPAPWPLFALAAKFAFPSAKSGSGRPRPACPCMRSCSSHSVTRVYTPSSPAAF